MALLQQRSSTCYRSMQAFYPSSIVRNASSRASRASRCHKAATTCAAAPIKTSTSMPTTTMVAPNVTSESWRASIRTLTSTQTSLALMFTALVVSVAAEGGIMGLLVLTALVVGYLYPADLMSFTGKGYRILQVVVHKIQGKTDIMTSEESVKTSEATTLKLPNSLDLAGAKSKTTDLSPSTVDFTSLLAVRHGANKTSAEESMIAPATNLPSLQEEPLLSVTSGASDAKAWAMFKPSPVDLSYAADQLAKPAAFRSMSINAVCVELPPREQPGRVRPEDFKHRGGITVSTNDADTFARKLAVQRQWEEQVEGGDLPRLSISSLSEVFACEWSALKLYVATPLDWGVNGPKAVTWGDMRVVAAFGIAAEAEHVGSEGVLAQASSKGQAVVGHFAAVTEGVTGSIVPSSTAGSAVAEAAGGAASARLAVAVAATAAAGDGKEKARKKGFGGKLLGVAKAVPLVAAVFVVKASMLLGGI